MRQIILAVLVTCIAAGSSLTFAEDTAHPRGQTGFTDGSNTESGTQVMTGQEAPQSGATSGAAAVTKRKKSSRHQKKEQQSSKKTETRSETKTVTE